MKVSELKLREGSWTRSSDGRLLWRDNSVRVGMPEHTWSVERLETVPGQPGKRAWRAVRADAEFQPEVRHRLRRQMTTRPLTIVLAPSPISPVREGRPA